MQLNLPSIGIGDIIDVGDLIGKTLFATANVPLYRYTASYYDGKPPIYTVKPGETIGVVNTWLQHGSDIWFLYYDSNKNLYVSRYVKGSYSLKKLAAQGVKTEEQKTKEAEQANKTWYEKLFSTKNFLIAGGIFLAATAIKNKAWK